MPSTKTETIYQFDELCDHAKERARDWYRSCWESDDMQFVIENAAECAKLIGIDIATYPVKLMGGSTRHDPAVFWSGFASQGDGACFEGRYAYVKGASHAVRDYMPKDTELHRIATELQNVQRQHFYRLEARMKHSGHYQHSGCMSVDVTDRNSGYDTPDGTAETICDLMRAFADWIYRSLEREYDYQNADEQIDENIRCNEYEFSEDGRRAS
jgi:hypothetical protein